MILPSSERIELMEVTLSTDISLPHDPLGSDSLPCARGERAPRRLSLEARLFSYVEQGLDEGREEPGVCS